jgi:hypothetical protein
MRDHLAYYARQGRFTDPEEYAHLFDGLPGEIPALCRVVQGLVIHFLWAKAYGVEVTDDRRPELEIHRVSRKLEHLVAGDPRPLATARDARARMLGTCRDFSVMLCGMLRHRGIPARVRFGFVFRSRSLDPIPHLQPLAVSRESRRDLHRVLPGSGRMVAARAKRVKRNLPVRCTPNALLRKSSGHPWMHVAPVSSEGRPRVGHHLGYAVLAALAVLRSS